MVTLIIGNAAAYLWNDGNWLYSILSVVLFPLTTFLWPFFSPDAASAWPLEDGVGLIYFFVIAVVAYPISTFVGGLDSV